MSDIVNESDEPRFALSTLPQQAVQALYHSVTGKTESLSRDIQGNVIIKTRDIDRLLGMLLDQLDAYPQEVVPTTTIVVKAANDQAITYSSIERFRVLRVENHEVTSEINVKIESVFTLPKTITPQRCIISLGIDSSLPVISKARQQPDEMQAFGFFLVINPIWKTIAIKIDFVDFLVAKSITRAVEEWFKTLKPTPKHACNSLLKKNMDLTQRIINQIPRIGFAAYSGAAAYFLDDISVRSIFYGLSLGLMLWAIFSVYSGFLSKSVYKRAQANMVPSVILLTDADLTSYDELLGNLNNPKLTALTVIGSMALAVFLNLSASYLFSVMNK